MNALSLDIYKQIDSMAIKAHRKESRISLYAKFVNYLSFIKGIFKIKHLSTKFAKEFNSITLDVLELLPEIPDLSKDDATRLYNKFGKRINTLVQLKEKLASIEYLGNPELEISINKCLDSFYVMEARLKKVAKKETTIPTDSTLKTALNTMSMENISSKLTR